MGGLLLLLQSQIVSDGGKYYVILVTKLYKTLISYCFSSEKLNVFNRANGHHKIF